MDNKVPIGLYGWTKITVSSDVTACDPGCNHTTCYSGDARISELSLGQELTGTLIKDKWWRDDIGYRFSKLYLIKVLPEGAVFQYGNQEIFVASEQSVKLETVPLSYAYAELFVRVNKEQGEETMSSNHDVFTQEEFDHILAAANNSDPDALNRLAYIRWYGVPRLNIAQDKKLAVIYWKKAAALNQPNSLYCCAIDLYFGENGEKEDKVKALELYRKSAELGYAPALMKMSEFYSFGIEGILEPDMEKFRELTIQCHKLGCMNAATQLGMIYYHGYGGDIDDKKAYDCFQENVSASGKWARSWARFYIGEFYRQGIVVAKSYSAANSYYKWAADDGVAPAMVQAGILACQGQGRPKDMKEAVSYWEKALEAGDADGAYYLAMYYDDPNGGCNRKLADEYQRKAADMGNEDAQKEIERGIRPGIPLDEAEQIQAEQDEKSLFADELKYSKAYPGLRKQIELFDKGVGLLHENKEVRPIVSEPDENRVKGWYAWYNRADFPVMRKAVYNDARPYAEGGCADAQYVVGCLLDSGLTAHLNVSQVYIKRDKEKAKRMFTAASNGGVGAACAKMMGYFLHGSDDWAYYMRKGALYDEPSCIKEMRDASVRNCREKDAFNYTKRLVELGEKSEMATLADYFKRGYGTKKDLEEAKRLEQLIEEEDKRLFASME